MFIMQIWEIIIMLKLYKWKDIDCKRWKWINRTVFLKLLWMFHKIKHLFIKQWMIVFRLYKPIVFTKIINKIYIYIFFFYFLYFSLFFCNIQYIKIHYYQNIAFKLISNYFNIYLKSIFFKNILFIPCWLNS